MDERQKVITSAAEAVINKEFYIEAPARPKNRLERLLQRFDKSEKVTRLKVRPVTFGTLTRLATIRPLMEAEVKSLNDDYHLQSAHLEALTEAAAVILHNAPGEPSPELVEWIDDNLTYPEMADLFTRTLQGLNLTVFIKAYGLDKKKKDDEDSEANSPWHLIGGVIKYFRFSYDYVLWKISYQNLNMLLATIPVYESDDETAGKKKKIKESASLDDLDKAWPRKDGEIIEAKSIDDIRKLWNDD